MHLVSRPFGTYWRRTEVPNVETLGYYRKSLRDRRPDCGAKILASSLESRWRNVPPAMMSAQQRAFLIAADCEVAFVNLTRQLYATDASIYQIEPVGVAFPKSAQEASLVIRAAADAGFSVTPRGAGTSLVGSAIGEGLIVDFSRYNRQITGLDLEKRSVRVEAGVVLDQLNDFLRPHGFCFGPDVATSSRATLGGMIANNSSG